MIRIVHRDFARQRFGWLPIAAVAALALSACGGGEQPAAPASTTPAAPEAAAPAAAPAAPVAVAEQLGLDELLKRARQALSEERLVTPPGDNAIEYYLQVLAQEPANPQATQALVDVFPLAAVIAERALAQRQLDEATRVIDLLDRVDPRSYTVSTLRGKLTAAQQVADREAQREAAAALAQQQAAARPVAPAPAPAAPQVAAPAPATPAPAAPEPSAPPQPAATPPAPPQPAPAQAAPPPPAAPAPLAAGETRDARPLRQVAPAYPVDAARKRQEGWVELEFTIGSDGAVRDVAVARAQPSRVFDREAVRAMQQWTFEPALRNGQPVEVRARRRIEFQL
jgi:protein TonB